MHRATARELAISSLKPRQSRPAFACCIEEMLIDKDSLGLAVSTLKLNLLFLLLVFFRARRKLWVYHCLSHWPDLALWSYHIWRKRCVGTSHRESDLGQFTVVWEQQKQGTVHRGILRIKKLRVVVTAVDSALCQVRGLQKALDEKPVSEESSGRPQNQCISKSNLRLNLLSCCMAKFNSAFWLT